MMHAVAAYLSRLAAGFGGGWTRFWFSPSPPDTLCAIRLAIGLVVVYLHATLSLDLLRFFGPDGMLPAADVVFPGTLTYHRYLHWPVEIWFVHLAGLAVLLLFTAGLWTRITSILALVVFLSTVNRAPIITSRTEIVCAFVMLYLCLGNCGSRFSLARYLPGSVQSPIELARLNGPATLNTIAARLMQVHLALLVAMMGLSMLSGEPWWNGDALWWLMNRSQSRWIDLTWLNQQPLFVDGLTHAIMAFHLAFPVLIWSPLARPLMLFFAALVWTLLSLLTGELLFGVTMAIAALAFVSPTMFRKAAAD